jgi:hypothetical protein
LAKRPATRRPSAYSEQVANMICDRLANGESLRSICREDGTPSMSSVMRWLRENEIFRQQYTSAREDQADYLFDEIIEIADDGSNDWMEREGKEVLNAEHINRSRLRVDARKWAASKMAPKKYGDKVTQIHEGGDRPVQLESVTNSDRIAAFKAMLQKAKAP